MVAANHNEGLAVTKTDGTRELLSGADIRDTHLPTGATIRTISNQSVDGHQNVSGLFAKLTSASDHKETVQALKDGLSNAPAGFVSASRDIDGHSLSATAIGSFKATNDKGNVVDVSGGVIQDTNHQSENRFTIVYAVGKEIDKSGHENGHYVDGQSDAEGIAGRAAVAKDADAATTSLDAGRLRNPSGVVSVTVEFGAQRQSSVTASYSAGLKVLAQHGVDNELNVDGVALSRTEKIESGTVTYAWVHGKITSVERKGVEIGGNGALGASKVAEALKDTKTVRQTQDVLAGPKAAGLSIEGVQSVSKENLDGVKVSASSDRAINVLVQGDDGKSNVETVYGRRITTTDSQSGFSVEAVVETVGDRKVKVNGLDNANKLLDQAKEKSPQDAKNFLAGQIASGTQTGVTSVSHQENGEFYSISFEQGTRAMLGGIERSFTGAVVVEGSDAPNSVTTRSLVGTWSAVDPKDMKTAVVTVNGLDVARNIRQEISGLSSGQTEAAVSKMKTAAISLAGVDQILVKEGVNVSVVTHREDIGAVKEKFSGASSQMTNTQTGLSVIALVGNLTDSKTGEVTPVVGGIDNARALLAASGGSYDQTIQDVKKVFAKSLSESGIERVAGTIDGLKLNLSREENVEVHSDGTISRQNNKDNTAGRANNKVSVSSAEKDSRGNTVSKEQLTEQLNQITDEVGNSADSHPDQLLQKVLNRPENSNLLEVSVNLGDGVVMVASRKQAAIDDLGKPGATPIMVAAMNQRTNAQIVLQKTATVEEIKAVLADAAKSHDEIGLSKFVGNLAIDLKNSFVGSVSIQASNGDRLTVNAGKHDMVGVNGDRIDVIRSAGGHDSVVEAAHTVETKLTGSDIAPSLLGDVLVQWKENDAAAITEPERANMTSLGFGTSWIKTSSGQRLEALVDNFGMLTAYQEKGAWLHATGAEAGQIIQQAMIRVSSIDSLGRNTNDDVGIKQGVIQFRAQVNVSKLDRANTGLVGDGSIGNNADAWSSLLSKYENPYTSVTLYGVMYKDTNTRGNIILSVGEEGSANTVLQTTATAFEGDEAKLSLDIDKGEGKFLVQVGSFQRDGSFFLQKSYGYSDFASFREELNVSLYDNWGNSVSAAGPSGNRKELEQLLADRVGDVNGAMGAIEGGWRPSSAYQVSAMDKDGNGVQATDHWFSKDSVFQIRTTATTIIEKDSEGNTVVKRVVGTKVFENGQPETAKVNLQISAYVRGVLVGRKTQDYENVQTIERRGADGEMHVVDSIHMTHNYETYFGVRVNWTKVNYALGGVGLVVGAVALWAGAILLAAPTGGASLAGAAAIWTMVLTSVGIGVAGYQGFSSMGENDNFSATIQFGTAGLAVLLPGFGHLTKGFLVGKLGIQAVTVTRAALLTNFAMNSAFVLEAGYQFYRDPNMATGVTLAFASVLLVASAIMGVKGWKTQMPASMGQTGQAAATNSVTVRQGVIGSVMQAYLWNQAAKATGRAAGALYEQGWTRETRGLLGEAVKSIGIAGIFLFATAFTAVGNALGATKFAANQTLVSMAQLTLFVTGGALLSMGVHQLQGSDSSLMLAAVQGAVYGFYLFAAVKISAKFNGSPKGNQGVKSRQQIRPCCKL